MARGMHESLMQSVIMNWAMETKHHEIVLPNVRALTWRWEADLISATRAWLVHEFEIKISRSDFRADAKKVRKHRFFIEHRQGSYDWSDYLPNYFWYATNGFDVELDNLPEYAGWLRVYWHEYKYRASRYHVEVEKSAPRLHGVKMNEKDRAKCARLLSYKLKNEYTRQFSITRKRKVAVS